VDFSKSEFNRSTQALRQTGSSFKPIVYASAIASGFRVSDVFMDSPIVFKNQDGTDWKPENFSGKFSGPMILLNAITYSKNVVTVKLLNKVGIGTVKKYARLLGITSPLANDLTLGLGSSSLSLLEMVSAFSALANGGSHVEPLSILSVKDSNGKNLEVNTPKLEQVIPDTTAYITTYMLENVVNRGTGRTIRNMGFNGPCAGKTGTTNDFTDAWYIGYTPDIVVGIWIGFDSKQTMGKGMVGGSVAAPIWGDFMLNSFSSSKKDFPVPDNIIFKKICTKSGMLATTACTHANTIDAPFVEGTEPLKPCTYHSAVNTSNFLNEDIESSTSASDDWDEEEAGVSIKYNDVKSKKPAVDDSDEENVRVIKQKDIGKSAKTPASSKSAVPVKNSAPANKPAAPAAKTSDDDSGYGGF
jgi:penicillin-binding protein 1A